MDGRSARAAVPHGRTHGPHAHCVTASAGQKLDDMELCSYLQDTAGSWSLVFDLSMTHDRFGSSSHVQQKGMLCHNKDIDAPLCLAAQRKINNYRQQYDDNQNISFLPANVSTSTRMHCEFLRLLFLQAHWETESHLLLMECHRNTTTRTRFVSSSRHSTSC